MNWIQEPEDDILDPMRKICGCIGATCKGRCKVFVICPIHLGNGCNTLTICGLYFGKN